MLDLKTFITGIDLPRLLKNDDSIWPARLRVADTTPANKMKPATLNISRRGIFLSISMTGRFSTLVSGPSDDGICHLSVAIQNGSGRVYIPDPIFLDIILTPGRVKDSLDATGDAGNQLMFPGIDWVTVFRPTDTITHNMTNDADYANSWQLCYNGIWLTGDTAEKVDQASR